MGDLKKLMIGVIIFSIVFVGFGIEILGDITTNYNATAENNLSQSSLNKITETQGIASEMSGEIQNSTISEDSAFYMMSRGGYTALKMTFSMFGIVTDIIQGIADYVGVPSWLITAAITIAIISILLIILSAIFRYNL